MAHRQTKIVNDRWQRIADLMTEKKLDMVMVCASQQDFGFGYALNGLKPIMYHYLTLDKKKGKFVRGYFIPHFLIHRLGLTDKPNVVTFDDKTIPLEFEKFLKGHKRVGVLGPAPALHFSKSSCELVFLDDFSWTILNKKDASEIANISATSTLLKAALVKASKLLSAGEKTGDIEEALDRGLLKNVDSLAFPSLVDSLYQSPSHLELAGKNECVKKKDLLFVNVGAELNGFYADAGRTFAINNPALKKKCDLLGKAFDIFVEKMKPGMKLTDLPAMLQGQLEEVGLKNAQLDKKYIGHSVGFNIINMPFIGETIFRNEKLLADTTLSFFVFVTMEKQVFKLQNTVWIGAKKNEVLTQ
jgi:Xaa-Pro aminopeptidase